MKVLQVGDHVLWQRVNWDRSAVASRHQQMKTRVTESFPATLIEIRGKRFLLEFEKNKVRKWVNQKDALLEKQSDSS